MRWSSDTEEDVLERDAITGMPIVTSAGEPINVTHPVTNPVLEIKGYFNAPFDPDVILLYNNKVNSDDFYGAPEGTAFMSSITADDEEVINERRVVPATFTIKFKLREDPDNPGSLMRDTWHLKLLNQGQFYLDYVQEEQTVTRRRLRALDENGHPIMVNLRLDGSALPLTNEGHPVADATYLDFNRFTKIDFNNLNLGPYG